MKFARHTTGISKIQIFHEKICGKTTKKIAENVFDPSRLYGEKNRRFPSTKSIVNYFLFSFPRR